MTRIRFVFRGGEPVGFTMRGHAGDRADAENDVVCAAISSAVYLTANTVTDVIFDEADITVADGAFEFLLKDGHKKASVDMLRGLALHLEGLQAQYPDKLTIQK